MGLFDKFKKAETAEESLLDCFVPWLDSIFEIGFPSDMVAINFNIYEDEGQSWSVEVVGTTAFDEEDDDWACCETTDFNTRENPFSWQENTTWEEVLPEVIGWIQGYLESGSHSEKLKALDGIACGFVDGNLETIYKK